MTRAVVTGVGAITPIGLTAHDFWKNLVAGVSGVGLTTRFDTTDLPVKISAEVKDFDAGKYMDSKGARRMSRFAQFAVAAAQLAADDAGLVLKDDERRRAASAIATGGGGVIETIDEVVVLQERGPSRVSPFYVPMMAPNMGACQVSMHLGLRGPALASVAACASGLYSYIEAKHLVDSGRADVVLARGTEAALHRLPIAAAGEHEGRKPPQRRARACKPAVRPRPWGFVFGEGAAVMVIESEARAKARGARVYCRTHGRWPEQRRLPHHGAARRTARARRMRWRKRSPRGV